MSTYTPVREWGKPLRNFPPGVSVASLFLIAPTRSTTIQTRQRSVQPEVDLVTTFPGGNIRLRNLYTIHFRTLHGLRTVLVPPMTQAHEKIEKDNIPYMLREMTGLAFETLASLARVSRNAYYKWLEGGGVSDEHLARLTELLDTFRTLLDLRGSDLKAFLETAGPAGRPIDLLVAGDSSAVIGLALRSPSESIGSSSVSNAARDISGLDGWLRPTTKLNWGAPRLTDIEREEALDRLSPRPLPEQSESLSDIDDDDDDEAFVAWGFVLK